MRETKTTQNLSSFHKISSVTALISYIGKLLVGQLSSGLIVLAPTSDLAPKCLFGLISDSESLISYQGPIL